MNKHLGLKKLSHMLCLHNFCNVGKTILFLNERKKKQFGLSMLDAPPASLQYFTVVYCWKAPWGPAGNSTTVLFGIEPVLLSAFSLPTSPSLPIVSFDFFSEWTWKWHHLTGIWLIIRACWGSEWASGVRSRANRSQYVRQLTVIQHWLGWVSRTTADPSRSKRWRWEGYFWKCYGAIKGFCKCLVCGLRSKCYLVVCFSYTLLLIFALSEDPVKPQTVAVYYSYYHQRGHVCTCFGICLLVELHKNKLANFQQSCWRVVALA